MSDALAPVAIDVDLDGLLTLAGHLKHIRNDIFKLGQGGPAGTMGGMGQAIVQQALADFLAAWAFGLDVIDQDMTAAQMLVDGAHNAYVQVENAIAGAAGARTT